MFKVGIIIASDKGAIGEREDKSGQLIASIVTKYGYRVEEKIIIPDEEDMILEKLIYMADSLKLDLILTTGGTGFSPRDRTPEATREACDRMADGDRKSVV